MQTTIKKIVAQFISSSDLSQNQFVRLYNLAVRGVENEFNLDICGTFKTELLNVEDNKTVFLPDDYINYSKIGIINNAGEFVTLKRNNQLAKRHAVFYDEANANVSIPTINSIGLDGQNGYYGGYNLSYYFNYFYSGTSYNLYGLPSGTASIGEYTIDVKTETIVLNPDFQYSQILLEYLSSGFDEDAEDYTIDSRAAEAMLAWIRWQNSIDQIKKYPAGVVAEYERRYYNEKRKAKSRINPFNLSDFNEAIRSATNLTPKA
jgi:hypothetical protein